ncbi:hypothetical protein [Nocardiopsis halophila]|uniref:hypothetical protein n=1 Tax=Nocardiopsis halophila TaxID=141692 RepID=UPI001267B58B|nr:hypothetical protein [Nocardiopsis halophila]
MPDYQMVSVHDGGGPDRGTHGAISRSTTDGAGGDEHWIVIACGNSTVGVGFDIRIRSTEPPFEERGEDAGFDREHRFTVRFFEAELVVDQGTMGSAAQIPLPCQGSYGVRVRSWNQDTVMREGEAIDMQASEEDWDLDFQREMHERLDGKEHYALDLWPVVTNAPVE